ncbi:MAG TPA: DegT/DnrJ/EryC1/StrS family aminotransferase, partial [Verrucomicrobiae bacterium]|nr:DegT/DnrJ/EryC1/StrS family aminotransferase [Verrucomicrobiae bacterium]
RAEGIACSAGYGFPLHRQPLFHNKAFGPFLENASPRLDYSKTNCPNSDRICNESIWLEQSLFLGPRSDMDDIGTAFEKIFENRTALAK